MEVTDDQEVPLVLESVDADALAQLMRLWALPHTGDPPFDFREEDAGGA